MQKHFYHCDYIIITNLFTNYLKLNEQKKNVTRMDRLSKKKISESTKKTKTIVIDNRSFLQRFFL